jgi:hypothetical protein
MTLPPDDGPAVVWPIGGPPMKQYNRARPGGAVYAVQNGDQYVYLYQNAPPYWVQPFANPPPVPDRLVQRAPSWLLSARHQVVPFYGREEELAWLGNWRDSTAVSVSVRLLHGPGGQGKTRLAAEFAAASSCNGWTVAAVRHCSEAVASGGADQHLAVYKPGLLIIVDYAERWPVADLIALLRQHDEAAGTPVRVLLLARPGGIWWQSLAYQLNKINIDDAQRRELSPLADQTHDRQALYAAAWDRFAAALGVGVRGDSAMPDLSGPHFGLVLAIHMKALADAAAVVRGEAPPSGRDQAGVSAYLLDREHDYWQAAHGNGKGPLRTSELAMSRAVYTATLTRPLSHSIGVTALTRAKISEATTQPVSQVLADHAILYPPNDPDTVLEPLYPDRLGEDFIALTTPGHAGTVYDRVEMWAKGLSALLISDSQRDDEPFISRSVITVLIEVAARWPHVAERELFPLLKGHPELARIAGGNALTRLAGLQSPGIIGILELVEKKLPELGDVDLDIGIAALTTRLTEYRLDRTNHPGKRAYLHREHAHRLGNAGLYDQALIAAEKSIDILRKMTSKSADYKVFLGLASMLRTLSIIHWALSRHEASLAAAQEAVQIVRALPPKVMKRFKSQLAHAVEGLGGCLMELGRQEEALAASQEAVEIYLQLIAGGRDDLDDSLAVAVVNQGAILAGMGRNEEAISATTRAEIMFRRFANDRPGAYMPLFAHSLDNLAAQLGDAGQFERALAVGEEALRLHQQLADTNPKAFRSRLLISVDNKSALLWKVGRREESLAAAQQALEILRQEFDGDQGSTVLELVRGMMKFSRQLWEMERREQAVAVAGEALQILRPLANAQSVVFATDLASTAKELGARIWQLERREEALAIVGEALQILRPLANAQPAAFATELVGLLNLLRDMLSLAEKSEEALASKWEEVQILRHATKSGAAGFAVDLARSLRGLATMLSSADRMEDSLAALSEIVHIWHGLVSDGQSTYSPDLTRSLEELSAGLFQMGRAEESLSPRQEAIELYRTLWGGDPALAADLARLLMVQAGILSDLGRSTEALAISEEAVTLRRELAEIDPPQSAELASALSHLSLDLADLGRHEEALSAANEEVHIWRRLADKDAAASQPDLARSVGRLAVRLFNVRRYAEALSTNEEAVELLRSLTATSPSHLSGLADAVAFRGETLLQLKHPKEAIVAFDEAVSIRKQRVAHDPTEDPSEQILDLQQRALASAEEAAQILRRSAYANPTEFAPHLADSMRDLAARLWELGHRNRAVSTEEQAIQILRRLAAATPDKFTGNLAAALKDHGARLFIYGRRTDALHAIEGAALIYRRLAESDPTNKPGLALSLNLRGTMLKWLRRYEEALESLEQTVGIFDELDGEAARAVARDKQDALTEMVEVLRRLGRDADAVAAERRIDEPGNAP